MIWRTSSATRPSSLSISSVLLRVSATSMRKFSSLRETSAAVPLVTEIEPCLGAPFPTDCSFVSAGAAAAGDFVRLELMMRHSNDSSVIQRRSLSVQRSVQNERRMEFECDRLRLCASGFDDRHAGTGSDSVCASLDHRLRIFERANSTRGLHPELVAHHSPHQ